MDRAPGGAAAARAAGLDAPPVKTCDGDFLLNADARAAARRYYLAGFVLPWCAATGAWLFLPDLTGGTAAAVQLYARRSAALFAVWLLALAWPLTYWIGGPALLGQATYDALNVANLDVQL